MLPAVVPASSRRLPRSVVVSAWAVPAMVVGQFAFLAVVPVTVLTSRVLRDAGLQRHRLPALLVAASWVLPFVAWRRRPDRPQSLSKDIRPLSVALVVASSAGLLLSLRRADTALIAHPAWTSRRWAGRPGRAGQRAAAPEDVRRRVSRRRWYSSSSISPRA